VDGDAVDEEEIVVVQLAVCTAPSGENAGGGIEEAVVIMGAQLVRGGLITSGIGGLAGFAG
jgi:hypothetical protein